MLSLYPRLDSQFRPVGATDSERAFWRRTLENGEATDSDLEHAIALMVKHADISDNLDESRLALLDPSLAPRLREKYAKALVALGLPRGT